ncbi:hypothetical protein TH53_25055 [Pedobacter lusitanus]|uniref:Uncharacterized protein n=1 Tax=Pedobacter lusitanus TaxID=1503925 RepID=A0A0D0EZ89_9SPHI|nr:hypothetical protein [Pedobacter lusitanus]KIO74698.1 hypothetical protein TH53_25055 [Pedobacter lusitanus]
MKNQKSIANLKAKNLGGFTKAFGAKVYGGYNTYTIEEVVIPSKPKSKRLAPGGTDYPLDSTGDPY